MKYLTQEDIKEARKIMEAAPGSEVYTNLISKGNTKSHLHGLVKFYSLVGMLKPKKVKELCKEIEEMEG